MTVADMKALPKRITQDNVSAFAGEQTYWFCPACRKWRTSPITEEGIACSVCGGGPDWEKHHPTLAYRSRYKRVTDLCADGADFRQWYNGLEQRYSDFIDAVNSGLSLRTQKTGWRYFGNAWRTVDVLADYLLSARDTPKTTVPYAYDEKGLQRRYFRPKRKHNTATLSDIRLKQNGDENGQYTDEEVAELMSYRAGFATPFYDQEPVVDELLSAIPVDLEREIAHDFTQGLTKREVERKYRLSESRVRTIVRHIAKCLRDM